MKITFADTAKTDIVAFIVDKGGALPASAKSLDDASGGLLSEAMSGGRFEGKKEQQAFVVLPKGLDAKRAVLIGGGDAKKRDDRALEAIGAGLIKANASSGFKSIGVHVDNAADAGRIGLGAKLAAYRFDNYFTKLKDDQKPSVTSFTIVPSDTKAAKASFAPLGASAE